MKMCRLSQDTINEILRRGRIYEVGGAVRDKFLFEGKSTKDRDYLVTGVSYDDLTAILEDYGRVDLVGRSFGVIKFTQSRAGVPHTFDITLPRKEHSTGTGHKDFSVDFDPNLNVEDDLRRRDFTVNAMAYALDRDELVDPLNGLVDLKNRQLRMVYDESFADDPLRMLRAVQFAARFNFIIEPETFAALRKNAHLMSTVSSERITEELNKLLKLAPRPSDGFRLMQTTGLLREILPELEECIGVDQPGGFHKYDVFEHTLRVIDACPPSVHLRLAALFHDVTKPQHRRLVEGGATFYGHEVSSAEVAEKVLERLRYGREIIRDVSTLVERHMFTTDVTDKGLRRLIKKVGEDLIFDLLELRRADVKGQGMDGKTDDVDRFEREIREELDRKPPFGLSDLAIDGNDIMRMFNIAPGKEIGDVLNHLMDQVLDDPSLNSREALEAIAREYYQKDIKHNHSDKESEE
ncbi:MAG: HD domain-containing protein [Candidatus Zixiibacteriota bacterium]|nr:MAG: HD domain-containing protein [candidate division Zixibacteria bacterium]